MPKRKKVDKELDEIKDYHRIRKTKRERLRTFFAGVSATMNVVALVLNTIILLHIFGVIK